MLTPEEKKFLEENGYVNLGVLLSDSELELVNARMEALKGIEGENAGQELVASKDIRHGIVLHGAAALQREGEREGGRQGERERERERESP